MRRIKRAIQTALISAHALLKLALLMGVACGLIMAYWVNSRPEDYFTKVGHWERVTDENPVVYQYEKEPHGILPVDEHDHEANFYQVVIPAGERQIFRTSLKKQGSGPWQANDFWLPLYEAELGQGSIGVSLGLALGKRPTENSEYKTVDPLSLRRVERFRDLHTEWRIDNKADVEQRFRIGFARTKAYAQSRDTPSYSSPLCFPVLDQTAVDKASIVRRICLNPITPAGERATLETVKADARGYLYLAIACALGWLVLRTQWLSMLWFLLPARSKTRTAYAVEDLEKQLDEARARNAELRRKVEEHDGDESEYETYYRELDEAIERVKELREKIAERDRREGDARV